MSKTDLWQRFIQNERLRRWVVLILLITVLYLVRSVMSYILLTFIFSFLVLRLSAIMKKHLHLPNKLTVIITYLIFMAGIYFAITNYVPRLIEQSTILVKSVLDFYKNNADNKTNNEVFNYIWSYASSSTVLKYFQNGASVLIHYLSNIGTMGLTFVMSLLLSFFYTFEKEEMFSFSRSFLKGPYAWFFQDIRHFGLTFVNTFGVVLEAQFIIAIVNTVITTVFLAFMGMPQLLSLGIMVFILSLIPVAGVIISAVPLCFIGYSVGGVKYIAYIIIMLIVVHALESYILNPKLMSSKTELPIFYTFVVLFFAEHIWGVWGLIVGIPVFTFALDILGVKPVGQKHQVYEDAVKRIGGMKKNE
ncbi:AI-2E family transporter [Ligilactobacillus equi]|nr:AI-2E family transporter [Ligilactobacillus equi]KRL82044.1 hypothetical protein FC36_GL001269 [Ligilactobacillus equi DSM 15833 = JCM 10991]MCQ2557090.1 AI-2E family transporter [Ligilactobacillus sp.]